MNPSELSRRVSVVPMDNGDIAVLTSDGTVVAIADVRPFAFGGTGLDGLLSAIQHAVNHIPGHQNYILPIRAADQGSPREIELNRIRKLYEWATKHRGAPRIASAPLPVSSTAQTVGSASEMGFRKKRS